ncbi:ATP-binding protein [Nocardia nova]|uniref:ATP-binding protein n=1 Tax=Nocardia nova TaxID=37330 RepID=UPI001893672D|nr:ATP-binding protein [Nocardia nova]MBF6150349.1 ATP-binding protein [Nocardia nova]
MNDPGPIPGGRYGWKKNHSANHVLRPEFYEMVHERNIVDSKVRQVFTPHQPIQPGQELTGRRTEIARLIAVLDTPGHHALLYGARGVGKSSLANAASHQLGLATTQPYFIKRCDHTDTFESIFKEPLKSAGLDVLRSEYVEQETRKRNSEGGIPKMLAGALEKQSARSATYRPAATIGASDAARHLSKVRGFMIVDELDVVCDETARRKTAELIKHLSDAGSKFKLLLVGIAENAGELTGAHPSVQRSLQETELAPMSDDQLYDIVGEGAQKLRLTFEDEVTSSIVRISAGYPHFTHLLALKCAEQAIRNNSRLITPPDLQRAMGTAAQDAEGILRQSYNGSIRTQPQVYGQILTAAASFDGIEFTKRQLDAAIPTGINLAGPLRRLVSNDGTTILRRAGTGVYRFSDPRMRCYIRIRDANIQ